MGRKLNGKSSNKTCLICRKIFSVVFSTASASLSSSVNLVFNLELKSTGTDACPSCLFNLTLCEELLIAIEKKPRARQRIEGGCFCCQVQSDTISYDLSDLQFNVLCRVFKDVKRLKEIQLCLKCLFTLEALKKTYKLLLPLCSHKSLPLKRLSAERSTLWDIKLPENVDVKSLSECFVNLETTTDDVIRTTPGPATKKRGKQQTPPPSSSESSDALNLSTFQKNINTESKDSEDEDIWAESTPKAVCESIIKSNDGTPKKRDSIKKRVSFKKSPSIIRSDSEKMDRDSRLKRRSSGSLMSTDESGDEGQKNTKSKPTKEDLKPKNVKQKNHKTQDEFEGDTTMKRRSNEAFKKKLLLTDSDADTEPIPAIQKKTSIKKKEEVTLKKSKRQKDQKDKIFTESTHEEPKKLSEDEISKSWTGNSSLKSDQVEEKKITSASKEKSPITNSNEEETKEIIEEKSLGEENPSKPKDNKNRRKSINQKQLDSKDSSPDLNENNPKKSLLTIIDSVKDDKDKESGSENPDLEKEKHAELTKISSSNEENEHEIIEENETKSERAKGRHKSRKKYLNSEDNSSKESKSKKSKSNPKNNSLSNLDEDKNDKESGTEMQSPEKETNAKAATKSTDQKDKESQSERTKRKHKPSKKYLDSKDSSSNLKERKDKKSKIEQKSSLSNSEEEDKDKESGTTKQNPEPERKSTSKRRHKSSKKHRHSGESSDQKESKSKKAKHKHRHRKDSSPDKVKDDKDQKLGKEKDKTIENTENNLDSPNFPAGSNKEHNSVKEVLPISKKMPKRRQSMFQNRRNSEDSLPKLKRSNLDESLAPQEMFETTADEMDTAADENPCTNTLSNSLKNNPTISGNLKLKSIHEVDGLQEDATNRLEETSQQLLDAPQLSELDLVSNMVENQSGENIQMEAAAFALAEEMPLDTSIDCSTYYEEEVLLLPETPEPGLFTLDEILETTEKLLAPFPLSIEDPTVSIPINNSDL